VSDAAGTLYVTDRVNRTIRKVAAGGVVTTLAGAAGLDGAVDGTGADARFGLPYGIAMDAAGNLYVADANNDAIRKVTPAGEVTTVVGTFGKFGVQLGALPASLTTPLDVAVRADGELLIVTANGVVVTQGF
jgi:glucose/arabinose dehydrogenase